MAERTSKRFISKNVAILNNLVSSKSGKTIDFYIEESELTGTTSTASLDWINNSRFSGSCRWGRPVKVESITIDDLIKRFGEPFHIKIDVEGYELEVLKGLTKKTCMISFEWAEEQKKNIIESVKYLKRLGYNSFNWLSGSDSYKYRPGSFMTADDFIFLLEMVLNPGRKEKWGMIYCQ